ncbi:tetraacyldisaccharide 4'-kinase [uncultured Lutibacter sp.]|uniref:tetraacyldisaccharide 4'-kinase n=1 Tax=uncultured Lutibacter sp. TaxID=437739 RepID=UPI0026075FEE|nr:tetraacyldisaccharide 4'-kinase [uncultured Lutibacter sp.]
MKFLRKILFPFSLLYGLITSMRNYLYDKHIITSTQFQTPTIVVGNLSVGGTGKTPQIEYLIRLLQNDYKIAVLSRGYKRKSSGFMIADENSTAEIIGDEPFQYYLKFPKVIVCVDVDRTNAIQQLEALENPPDIILLDDAFQHRRVNAGFNILLTAYHNLYVDDHMLPTGDLREKKSGAKRAQVIIVTKCPINISEVEQFEITQKLNLTSKQSIFFTAIEYDNELKGASNLNLSELKNTETLLVTGIANPTPLVEYLTNQKIKFKHIKYPDHYQFKEKDIAEINSEFKSLKSNNNIVLTTEKDYVRIFADLQNLRYISIKTKFVKNKTSFDKLIKKYVE